jgi:hypothetical protein
MNVMHTNKARRGRLSVARPDVPLAPDRTDA